MPRCAQAVALIVQSIDGDHQMTAARELIGQPTVAGAEIEHTRRRRRNRMALEMREALAANAPFRGVAIVFLDARQCAVELRRRPAVSFALADDAVLLLKGFGAIGAPLRQESIDAVAFIATGSTAQTAQYAACGADRSSTLGTGEPRQPQRRPAHYRFLITMRK